MFEIVVTKITQEERAVEKYQRLTDTGNVLDGGPTYGYVSTTERGKVELEVFRQKVDELYLPNVVLVVNGLKTEKSVREE